MDCFKEIAKQGTEEQISSEVLKEDKRLEFSNKQLENIIKESLQPINSQNQKFNELSKSILFPSNYIFASLAHRIYCEKRELSSGNDFHGKKVFGDWRLLTVAYSKDKVLNGYVGGAYWNPDMQQVIIVHRGTHNMGGGFADFKGVILNQHVAQIDSAVTFTLKIISILKEINANNGSNIHLFLTGHSLGGWLAAITSFAAKYLVKKGDNFIASNDFEKTGYHVSAVMFDSPGCKNMLESIQNNLMNRYSSYLIDSLDIRTYLSMPNLVNTCNPQVGEVYRIFINLSEKEKHKLQKMNIINYTRFAHSITKIEQAFNPNFGSIKIRKVLDWPLLISKDEKLKHWNEIFWGIKAALQSLPMVGQALKANDLYHELKEFFKLGNVTNEFDIDEKSAYLENGARKVRYRTQGLDENHEDLHNSNVFTQVEYRFLVCYKLIESRQKDSPLELKTENMFSCFKESENMKNKTIKMLNNCKINKGVICSKYLTEFIPYIKRLLHFFPEMKSEVEKAWQDLPVYILTTFYRLASFSYLKTFQNILRFKNNYTLELGDFLRSSVLNILQVVDYNIFWGCNRVYKILMSYKIQNNYIFLNLNGILKLGDYMFIEFLKKLKDEYLLVIECDEVLNDKEKGFFQILFSALKHKYNIKVILITERDSKLSEFVMMCNETSKSFCRKCITDIGFNHLTPESQKNLLDEKIVIFQGKEIPLFGVINSFDSSTLNTVIDTETIFELLKNGRIEIGKSLPTLENSENFYIERKLIKKIKVNELFLEDCMPNDLFLIGNVDKSYFSNSTDATTVRNFEDNDPDKTKPVRFIAVKDGNDGEYFKKLLKKYPLFNIHWIKREYNNHFIWQKTYGSLCGLRKFIENYYIDLQESQYSENNPSVSIIDVDDINNDIEKFIIIAAEPGMGKSTALSHLENQRTDDFKWFIRINLVERKNELEQINISVIDDVVSFLHEDGINNTISSRLTKRLIKYRLVKDGNIVLLLDGFDEITEKGQKTVMDLLKILHESEVEKVLISTRLHLKEELEDCLSTFSYSFKPFYHDDQEQFLKKFWKNSFDHNVDKKCLDNYISNLLKNISESIGDTERNFMGIPLQMRMVAEAFKEDVENWCDEFVFPENFDILQLYDRFVDAKYDVYSKKIGINMEFSNVQKYLYTKEINKMHMRLAVRELIPEFEKSSSKNILSEEVVQEMTLIGIIQCINKNIFFIHRTFAEYFIAKFIAHRLESIDKDTKKYHTIIEFLTKELFESKNNVIKTFLDYCLAKENIHFIALKGKHIDVKCKESIIITDTLGRSAMHYAAQGEHKEVVDNLLKKGANVEPDELGKTPLHYAARYNKGTHIISCLLSNFKDCMNVWDKNGRTALYYATEQSNWEIVDIILAEEGASIHGLNEEKVLFRYAYEGNLQNIKNLLKEEELGCLSPIQKQLKQDVLDLTAIKDNHGNTLLHIAAQRGHIKIVEFLLDKKVGTEITNKANKRPLHFATENGHWNIVQFLIEKNANFSDLRADQMQSLLKYSTENACWYIVRLLLKNNQNEYYDIFNNEQLLCHVISYNDTDIVEALLEKCSDLDHLNNVGKKPIYYALEQKNWYIVKLLVRKWSNFSDLTIEQKFSLLNYSAKTSSWDIISSLLEDTDGNKYLDSLNVNEKIHYINYLICVGNSDLTKKLIDQVTEKENINIDTLNSSSETFLHVAAKNTQLNIMQYLVDEKRANVNAVTDHGSTPLHFAVRNNEFEVVKYLIEKGADIFFHDKCGKSPMTIAQDENYRQVEELLSEYSTLYKIIFDAVEDGNIDVIESLIGNKNININFLNQNGLSPSHKAVIKGKLDVLKYLYQIGTDFNIRDRYGNTVLHWTSFSMYTMSSDTYLTKEVNGNEKKWCYTLEPRGETILENTSSRNEESVEILYSGFGKDPPTEFGELDDAFQNTLLSIMKYVVDLNCLDLKAQNFYNMTALHTMAASGFLNAIKYLIEEKGLDVNLRSNENKIPLHYAINEDVAEYLIKMGSKINVVDNLGYIPLHCAAKFGYLEVVKFLLKNGSDLDVKDKDGFTPLHLAVINNKFDIIQFFIDEKHVDLKSNIYINLLHIASHEDIAKYLVGKGYNINGEDSFRCKPLHSAARCGILGVVKYFIKEGSCLDAQNENGDTPLHLAASCNEIDTVKYLIDQGADLTMTNIDGKIPIDLATESGIIELLKQIECDFLLYAASQGDLAKVRSFMNCGVDVNVRDNNNRTPLNLAINNCDIELIKYLLENGANVLVKNTYCTLLQEAVVTDQNEVLKLVLNKIREGGNNLDCCIDMKGNTLLMKAADMGKINAFQVLLLYGSNIETKNKDGMTALHWSAKSGDLVILQHLIAKGANIHTLDNDGRKPIHIAAQYGNKSIIEHFLNRKLIVDETDKDGWTCLHYAICNQKSDIVNFLLNKGANINHFGNNGRTPLYLALIIDSNNRKPCHGKRSDSFCPSDFNDFDLDFSTMLADVEIDHKNQNNDPISLKNHYDLTKSLCVKGQSREAFKILKILFSVPEKLHILGFQYPDTLFTFMNIAIAFSNQNKFEEALRILTEILDIQKNPEVLGSEHSYTLTTQYNIAEVLYKKGEFTSALEMLKTVLKGRRKTFGFLHGDVFITRLQIARVLTKLNKPHEGLEILYEVYELQKVTLGRSHPDVLITMHMIYLTFIKLDEFGSKFYSIRAKQFEILRPEKADTYFLTEM